MKSRSFLFVFIPCVFAAIVFFGMSSTAAESDENEVIEPTGTEGTYNTYYGKLAGNGNTGNYVTFLGAEAGAGPNTGGSNVFIGQRTGWKNTSGGSNTFVGRNAGLSPETDYQRNIL